MAVRSKMTFSKERMMAFCRHLGMKSRNFLHTPQCREFLFFLFFVFVASAFWIIHTLNDTYETEVAIPLRLKNLPDNAVVTSEFPKQINLTVRDKGTVLVNYMLGQGFVPLNINFNDYSHKGDHVIILTEELQKKIAGQLAVSTTLLDVSPDTLEIIYTRGEGKRVPVRMNGSVTTGRQYYLAGRQITPDSIMVYAPASILDTLNAVYTEPVRLTDVADTMHIRKKLIPVKGARFNPEEVDIHLYADILTEKSVSVPVVGTGFPADKQLKTFPSKVELTFQVGLQHFKRITADDFRVEVNYDELQRQPMTEECTPRVTRLPEEVNHVRLSPRQVEYLIEQK